MIQNDYARVNSLPVEILSEILIQCVKPSRAFQPTPWRDHVKYTLVCKLWRRIALACPAYWSCIPVFAWSNSSVMLERSGTVPFSCRVVWPPGSDPENKKPLSGSSSVYGSKIDSMFEDVFTILDTRRLQELHIYSAHFSSSRYSLEKMPQMQTPLLHSLQLYNIIIPVHLLNQPLPSLQQLELTHCLLLWDWEMEYSFPSLKKLKVEWLTPRFLDSCFLRLLSSSKLLEQLTMTGTLPDGESFSALVASKPYPSINDTIVLNHLRSLELFDDHVNCTSALHHISHPKSTSVVVDMDYPWERTCGELFDFKTNMCSLIRSYQRNAGLAATSSLSIAIAEPDTSTPPLNFSFGDRFLLSVSSEHLEPYLDTLIVEGLKKVTLTEAKLETEARRMLQLSNGAHWMAFLARHPDIEELQLVGTEAEAICDLLQDLRQAPARITPSWSGHDFLPDLSLIVDKTDWLQSKDPSQTGSAAFVVPSLKNLYLEQVDFRAHPVLDLGPLIKARSLYGCPLQLLHFADCLGVSEEEVDALREFMKGEIQWSGAELLSRERSLRDVNARNE